MYFNEIDNLLVVNPRLVHKKIVIWGAGKAGKMVYDQYVSKGICDVLCYVDSDSQKWDTTVFGIRIISPEELKKYDKSIPVIIATNNRRYYEDISFWLHDQGYTNVFSILQNLYLPSTYDIEVAREQLSLAGNEINTLFSLLHDDISRQVFDDILHYRLSNNRQYIRHAYDISKQFPQYFPDKSIYSPQDDEIFVDGGCCDAATIGALERWNGKKYTKAYAFEPSMSLGKLCKDNIEMFSYKAELINKGLWSKTEELRFASGNNKTNGKLSEEGEEVVQVVSLDDFFKNERVTFIKMDIEGAEMEALKGGIETIRKNHPKLAISIYHKFSDLWEIPCWIHSNFPDYKLYIRHHSPYSVETIVYARWDDNRDYSDFVAKYSDFKLNNKA